MPMRQNIPLKLAARRAVLGRCPCCGEGELYRAYLKQVENCAACGERFGHIRADDAAPDLGVVLPGSDQRIDESRPLVVTRTYSKTWSMAAARLGYLIGPSWLVAELEKVVLPYHLDTLKQIRRYLLSQGVNVRSVIKHEGPGSDYTFDFDDPEGNRLQFFSDMDQIGWDGKPQPAAQRPHIDNAHWPELLDPVSDVYCGEVFLGPVG